MLDVQDITVAYSSNAEPTIEGFHLKMKPGEICSIVGESGSGKTTVIRSILGLLPGGGKVTKGDILFEGESLLQYSKKQWRELRGTQISMIFQDPMTSLNPTIKIGEQIAEAILIHHRKKTKDQVYKKVIELMELVGIERPQERYHAYPYHFSGGMRQRAMIAMALSCNPKLLIADEPTTALDVTIQAQILQLLKELRAKYHLTIVMITHDLGVVANIADRVAVMYAGDIVEIGTADEIYYDPRHPYTWALLSSMPQMGIKGEDLFNIVGTPPNLFAEIRGDAFAPRNPQALKIDFVKRPPYFAVSPAHKARTWLLDPRAPRIEPPAAVKKLQKEGL